MNVQDEATEGNSAGSAVFGQFANCQQPGEDVDGEVGGTIAVIGQQHSVVAPGPSQGHGSGSVGRQVTFRLVEDDVDGFINATPSQARPTGFGFGLSLQHVQRMLEQLMHGPRVVISGPPPVIPLPPARRPVLASNDLRHRIQPGRLVTRQDMSRPCLGCQPSGPDVTEDIQDNEPARKRVRFT